MAEAAFRQRAKTGLTWTKRRVFFLSAFSMRGRSRPDRRFVHNLPNSAHDPRRFIHITQRITGLSTILRSPFHPHEKGGCRDTDMDTPFHPHRLAVGSTETRCLIHLDSPFGPQNSY